MSDLAKRLGRRIYEFRKQNRLTQAALAEKARISNEFMSYYGSTKSGASADLNEPIGKFGSGFRRAPSG